MLALALAGHATSALARQPAAQAPAQAPAGAVVELSIEQRVGSALNKRGDRFPIRLNSPVAVGDVVVLPAGLIGEGEVIHAQPSGMAGKPGELTLAARFLVNGAERVPLKAMKMGAVGGNNLNAALALSFAAGPLALFVEGGEVVIPAGAVANAKLASPYPASVTTPANEPEKAPTQ